MTTTERFREKLTQSIREVEHDGFPMRLRLIPVEIWIEHGKVPQHLANTYLRAISGDEEGVHLAAAAVSQMTDDDALALLRFKQSVIEYAAIEPKIVFADRELAEGEISAAEVASVAPGILDFIFNYATGQAAQSPVETITGEISAGALESFHQDSGSSSPPSGFVVHGSDFQADALTIPGDQ